MKVGRVADELDMLVAKVAEEVTDTVQTLVEMAGLKCVSSFYGNKHSELLYVKLQDQWNGPYFFS